ncbi:calcium-binding protein [uncultured Propionivibrio sp.]|uniref:calcium-binding protein n=1 Tax=uncultured Propionivibrio sp. TaxID=426737 RepID=UPI0029C0A453|nr:calcium-binding protein [uncultured Propionivibrio sp.]
MVTSSNHTLIGGSGNDGLFGLDGDDSLSGGAGNDGLSGGAGNDTLDGGAGEDRMAGGNGDDLYRVDNSRDAVDEIYSSGIDTVESSISFSLQPGAQVRGDIENLTLTGGANIDGTGNALINVITGNSGANHLYGQGGNDTLDGGDGNDSLLGGAGNDVLDGGAGLDTMIGGAGNDVYVIDDKYGDKIIEAAGGGIDTLLIDTAAAAGWGGYALSGGWGEPPWGQEVEAAVASNRVGAVMNLHGNTLNNVLWGNDWGSVLEGYEGNDILYGAGGNDTLYGGAGNDIYRFDRGCGADLIVENDASAGNRDTLFIDARADQLWFRRSGNDLVIDIMGSQDASGNNPTNKVTIQNHYAGTQYQVERFVSSDGKVLAAANADAIVCALSWATEDYGDTAISKVSSRARQLAYGDVMLQWHADATVSNLISAMAQMAAPPAGTTLAPADYQGRVTAIYAANAMV